MENAQINLSTYDTLENKAIDPLSTSEHLPITVYLDNLRSAFNVGSILRTMEAFRFKTIFFAKNTPTSNHTKVVETSMDTAALIDVQKDFSTLPKPFIALECTESATSIYDFSFPETFTLILGNEALGISQEMLLKADYTIKIPLIGAKNSLNVASAFSITAFEIARQRNAKLARLK
jgi:tRNA G18 (ribose-2'-O)-methylase SpoU